MDSSPIQSSSTRSSSTRSSPDAPARERQQTDEQSREALLAGPRLNTPGSEAPRAEASYASIEHADAPIRDRPPEDGQHREIPEAAADSDAVHVAPHADGPSRASPRAEQLHDEQPRATSTSIASMSRSSYISRATRRRVVERDGLRCSWTDEHGTRCESRAWLEFDHQTPLAKGGGSRPENVRLLCRNHNRLAAEQAFGKPHIDHAIATRKQADPSPLDPPPAE